ncbi:glycoside hydrolase family 88 protein [Algisphaera agarilytica]|uniref:Unsaturated chondroitin disaccharide hydrolase n=1 Tax=Algisphaera agarilytica TaxID=1385975 RepID=A0A7X0H7V6_9BACT|nr:glycoside hydrolase family 88 protein [Algisphaera agarilytica]MBB6430871.1 unsaturated chondroitin disaccharide hydrolase [Algisphaera agarilytica]
MSLGATAQGIDVDAVFTTIDQRVTAMAAEATAASAGSSTMYPNSYIAGDSGWTHREVGGWTTGFYPGILWKMYEQTGKSEYKTQAESWTMALIGLESDDAVTQTYLDAFNFRPSDHDIGFVFNTAFGNAYRITGEERYKAVLNEAAERLDNRFDPSYQAIKSWDWGTWNEVVIIDNMINLELLWDVAAEGGPSSYADHALAHAQTTAEYHVRNDGTTYHTVEFGFPTPQAGTYQGYEDESTWARGQAWGIYGFTMAYREAISASVSTSEADALLDIATDLADYFLANLPDDNVPFWDFELFLGDPDLFDKDTSAAAITASALIELSQLVDDPDEEQRYFEAAEDILEALLSATYFAADATGESRLLLHGVGAHPDAVANGQYDDETLIYGEYYLIEALQRYQAVPEPAGLLTLGLVVPVLMRRRVAPTSL